MANAKLSNAAAIVANDAIVDLLDIGATNPGARILIFSDAGPQPAGPDAASGASILLATLEMDPTAFGASIDGAPNAVATAAAIMDDVAADATGTASWFRVTDKANLPVIDGDITATSGGGDLELNTVSLVLGAVVSISAFTFTHLE